MYVVSGGYHNQTNVDRKIKISKDDIANLGYNKVDGNFRR